MAVHPSAAVPIMRPHLPPLDQFAQLVAELFETRMLSNFGEVHAGLLEERASGLLDHPSPLCVSSCDIGLTLAWQALECPPGDVIVPSFTFCSTVNALRWNGLVPVFADVDPQTYCIDVEDVRPDHPRTVGIAAVHVFGLPAAIEPLDGLAREHGLKLIFDAAQGLGGRYRGTALGAFGDASAFSLSGTKLVTGGEGGLVTFRDPADAERFTFAEGLRVQGRLQLPICRSQRQALGAERGPRLALARLARGRPSPSSFPGRAVSAEAGRLHWPELAARAARVRARLQGSRRQVPKAGAACGRRGRPRGRRGHDETLLLPRPSHGGLPRVHEPLLARDRPPPRTPLMHPPLLRPIRRSHRWHRRDHPPKPRPRVDAPLRGLRLARAGRARSRRGIQIARIFRWNRPRDWQPVRFSPRNSHKPRWRRALLNHAHQRLARSRGRDLAGST